MRNRLTERDLSRIVRRVVNEEVNSQQPELTGKIKNFKNELMRISGIREYIADNLCKVLFGVYWDGNAYVSKGEDLETRLKNYDKFVTTNSLPLPSSSIIKLFKQLS